MSEKGKNALVLVGLGLFVVAVVYLMVNFSMGRTNLFGRAQGEGIFNSANSYVFASPLLARVGGEKIRVTVFALDGRGRGIGGKKVNLRCVKEDCDLLKIEDVQVNTDSLGRAIFDISSSGVGQFEFQAFVEGVAIPQKVTVTFQ